MALPGVWNRISGALMGIALGRASSDAVTPVLENAKQRAWAERAVRVLDAGEAATADVLGVDHGVNYQDDAKRQGVGVNRYRVLRDLAGQAPGLGQLLQMRNRGIIQDAGVLRGLQQNGVREEWAQQVLALRFGTLDAGTLATLAARGLLERDVATGLADDSGVSDANFARMINAAAETPTVGQILEWGNRTGQSDAEVSDALEVTGLRSGWRGRVAALRHYLTPPSDLIRMAVREVFSPGLREELSLTEDFPEEFAERAALLGMDRATAVNYWAAHWDLPSLGQLNEMRFRAGLTPQQYNDALRAIDIAPFWRPFFAKIAHRIPTVTDFQRLVRRGVYGGEERQLFQYDAEYPAEFTEKMALHGLSEQDAKDLWAGGWRMPSAGQLYKMLWRGEIEPPELRKGLKALDYPVFWRERLANIARPIPPRVAIERLHKAGIIGDDRARDLYQQLGYSLEHANLLLRLKVPTKIDTTADLTLTQLASEFERGMISGDEFAAELRDMGYDAEEVAALRALSNRKRVDRAREQKIATIRTAYVGHRLREAEARAALAASGIPATAVDDVFTEWKDARAANVRVLSPTNLKSLYKAAKITIDEAREQLVFRGYDPAAADQLISTWD